MRRPLQRLMLERAGCDPVIEIDTDHSPQISRVEELVAALDRLATSGPARIEVRQAARQQAGD